MLHIKITFAFSGSRQSQSGVTDQCTQLFSGFLADKDLFCSINSFYDPKGHGLAFPPALAILNLQLLPGFAIWLLSSASYSCLISCHEPVSVAQTHSLCQDPCRWCWVHSLLPALHNHSDTFVIFRVTFVSFLLPNIFSWLESQVANPTCWWI